MTVLTVTTTTLRLFCINIKAIILQIYLKLNNDIGPDIGVQIEIFIYVPPK